MELKREAKALRDASKKKMGAAGFIFNEINMNNHAA